MSLRLEGPVLKGALVRHAADLAVAAEENRAAYSFTWVPSAAEVHDYIDAQPGRAAAGRMPRMRRCRSHRAGPLELPPIGTRACGRNEATCSRSRSASRGWHRRAAGRLPKAIGVLAFALVLRGYAGLRIAPGVVLCDGQVRIRTWRLVIAPMHIEHDMLRDLLRGGDMQFCGTRS
jgi:hypothetical protein